MHANNVALQGVSNKCIHSVVHCMLCYPQRLNGEAEVSRIEEQLNSRRNAFVGLRKENMEYEQNVEDYKIKLSERYSGRHKMSNIWHYIQQ